MIKIFNFALQIKEGGRKGDTCEVLRPCYPPKFGTCTFLDSPFGSEKIVIAQNERPVLAT